MARFCPACGELYPAEFERCSVDGVRLVQELEDQHLGQTLGSFKIEEKIGGGSVGDVYRALDLDRNQDIAIKILKTQLHSQSTVVQRFHREARVIRELDHPNIVKLFDFGQSNGFHFMAMELIEGRTLHRIVEEDGPMEPARVAYLGLQVARGLAAAHEKGLVHRDLKPGNIMLTKRGSKEQIKVLDFSIVGYLDGHEKGPRLTQHGTTVGTPAYMAPEQMEENRIDARADLYSLGVVLFELLVGVPPFMGTYMSILKRKMTEPPPGIPSYDGLGSMVLKLLSISPDRRPQSAREVVSQLESAMSILGMGTTTEIRVEDMAAMRQHPRFDSSISDDIEDETEMTELASFPAVSAHSIPPSAAVLGTPPVSISVSDEMKLDRPKTQVLWGLVVGAFMVVVALLVALSR